jgi:integrase
MRLKLTTRHGSYHVDGYGPDGARVRRSLKTTDARRAQELRAKLEADLWAVHMYGPSAIMTFDQAALAYAKDGGEVRYLVKMSEQLAGVTLHKITPQMVRAAAKKALPNRKPATVNRQGVVPARAVINYAHAQGWCAPIKVAAFKVDKVKKVAVEADYLTALKPHLMTHSFAALLFIHTTGRRISEAVSLTPNDIDLNKGTAYIEKTKNGDPAYASLVPALVEILRELEPRHGRVFGYMGYNGIYKTLKRACRLAGVEYLATHQPGRHSFATNLHENEGWTSKAIADAGGWKSPRLVEENYIHTNDSAARATALLGKNWSRPLKVVK